MMKINRLLEITIILLNRGTITAKELAARFNVSTRTIYRDIEVLSVAGVPVYTNKGSKGGISILEEYAINRTIVNEKERDSMILALKTLKATKFPEIDSAIAKIGGLFKTSDAYDWVYVEFSNWGSHPNEENKFDIIKSAILQKKKIEFRYVNSESKVSKRVFEPMKLIYKGYSWYLWGYCNMREDFRLFRISRMDKLKCTDEIFERRKKSYDFVDKMDNSNKRLLDVKLKFKEGALYRVYDNFGHTKPIENNDGTYNVKFKVNEDDWIYSFILSFGDKVTVLEPDSLKKEISNIIKRMQKNISY